MLDEETVGGQLAERARDGGRAGEEALAGEADRKVPEQNEGSQTGKRQQAASEPSPQDGTSAVSPSSSPIPR